MSEAPNFGKSGDFGGNGKRESCQTGGVRLEGCEFVGPIVGGVSNVSSALLPID